mmetsp:Transcript_94057/g.255374  ORF Transcript_94057/g.255374 Transcript_94057/m.255374 type:complete len:210 (+) Transcript_94057:1002-1631(+)
MARLPCRMPASPAPPLPPRRPPTCRLPPLPRPRRNPRPPWPTAASLRQRASRQPPPPRPLRPPPRPPGPRPRLRAPSSGRSACASAPAWACLGLPAVRPPRSAALRASEGPLRLGRGTVPPPPAPETPLLHPAEPGRSFPAPSAARRRSAACHRPSLFLAGRHRQGPPPPQYQLASRRPGTPSAPQDGAAPGKAAAQTTVARPMRALET